MIECLTGKVRFPCDEETCPYCGAPVGDDEGDYRTANANRLVCPKCSRDGCPKCMPAGRGCMCPECEEGDNE